MTAALAAPPYVRTHQRRVVLRPAPVREPPFDDERPDAGAPTALDQRLPFEIVRARPGVWAPARRRPHELPEPGAWARRLLIGMTETAGGRRPLQQLAAFLSPSVLQGIGADFERAGAAGTPHWLHRAAVRSVRVCEISDSVVELCAVLDAGPRARAVAMRVEQWRGHWRCTRLQIG